MKYYESCLPDVVPDVSAEYTMWVLWSQSHRGRGARGEFPLELLLTNQSSRQQGQEPSPKKFPTVEIFSESK